MLADARHNDARALFVSLFHHDFAHDTRVVIVQMRDGFVG